MQPAETGRVKRRRYNERQTRRRTGCCQAGQTRDAGKKERASDRDVRLHFDGTDHQWSEPICSEPQCCAGRQVERIISPGPDPVERHAERFSRAVAQLHDPRTRLSEGRVHQEQSRGEPRSVVRIFSRMCLEIARMKSGGTQLPICLIPSSNPPPKQNSSGKEPNLLNRSLRIPRATPADSSPVPTDKKSYRNAKNRASGTVPS